MMLELSNLCTDIVVSFALGQGRPSTCGCADLDAQSGQERHTIAAGVELLYLVASFLLSG